MLRCKEFSVCCLPASKKNAKQEFIAPLSFPTTETLLLNKPEVCYVLSRSRNSGGR